jgi:hypothetical protein
MPQVPALFRALIRDDGLIRYRFHDDVDPHAPSGGRVRSDEDVTCRVDDISVVANAVTACIACELPIGDFCYVVNARGLWRTTSGPSVDEPAVVAVTSQPPDVPADGAAYDRTFDAGEPGDPEPCRKRGAKRKLGRDDAYCVETACKPPRGYGKTRDWVCFSERGIVLRETENLAGPRRTKMSRMP